MSVDILAGGGQDLAALLQAPRSISTEVAAVVVAWPEALVES